MRRKPRNRTSAFKIRLSLVALKEALHRHDVPEIFNTDQGAQFTSEAFTKVLKAAEIKISMDGKGRWIDNVFVEHHCFYMAFLSYTSPQLMVSR